MSHADVCSMVLASISVCPKTLARGCSDSLHPMCLAFLPRESEVWGWEKQAAMCLSLSTHQRAFQPE